jgi:hypothetical protein
MDIALNKASTTIIRDEFEGTVRNILIFSLPLKWQYFKKSQ